MIFVLYLALNAILRCYNHSVFCLGFMDIDASFHYNSGNNYLSSLKQHRTNEQKEKNVVLLSIRLVCSQFFMKL